MSVWTKIKTDNDLPPLNEEVMILYKDKTDELTEDNLYYGIARRLIDVNFNFEKWTHFTEYQGYYEVVYWARLYDLPHIRKDNQE